MTVKTEAEPFMMTFKESFEVPRVEGQYNSEKQIREIKDSGGKVIPFIESNDMTAMGSTRTGERSGEH